MRYWFFLFSFHVDKPRVHVYPWRQLSRGGGGTTLFGLYGYVPLNRVWFSTSWVLNRVYNFTIKRLEQDVFLDWKPFKECKDLQWAVYFAVPITFSLNSHFHDFSVKNYLILYAKQNKSGSESSVSCLKQHSEISNFCLKQGWSLESSTAQLHPDLPWGSLSGQLQYLVAVSNASGFFFFSTSLLLQCDYTNRGHPDKKWDKFWK